MVVNFDSFSQMKTGQEAIITRVLESVCGDSGVHEARRGVDVRDEFEGGRLYTDNQVKMLVEHMNTCYPRNDGKPTCIHHSFAGGPLHFHIQIALSTLAYEPLKSVPNHTP